MQAAAAGTGVRLSDGSTNLLPVGDRQRPRGLGAPPPPGHQLARARLLPGLGPAPGPAADPVRRDVRVLPQGCPEPRRPAARPTSAAPSGAIADEPATARALAGYLLRGLECGAVTDGELRRPRLDLADIRARGPERRAEMGIVLGANQYGKAEKRVVRIYRDTPRHEIRDLNVSTSLRGDFADAHVTGDQAQVLPTDTQKNTAFAFAKEHGVSSPEEYALALGGRLLEATPAASGALVRVEEYAWDRVRSARARPHVRAPRRRGAHGRGRRGRDEHGAVRPHRPGGAQVHRLGVQGVPARRVHDAARRRRPDPGDLAHRQLAAHAEARERRLGRGVRTRSRDACSRRSPTTYSRALQETLYAMGRLLLEAHADDRGDVVRGAQQAPLPGRPRRAFGLENPGEVFIAADRPYGLIEAPVTVTTRRRMEPGWSHGVLPEDERARAAARLPRRAALGRRRRWPAGRTPTAAALRRRGRRGGRASSTTTSSSRRWPGTRGSASAAGAARRGALGARAGGCRPGRPRRRRAARGGQRRLRGAVRPGLPDPRRRPRRPARSWPSSSGGCGNDDATERAETVEQLREIALLRLGRRSE